MERDGVDRRRYIRVKFPFTIHVYPPRRTPISAYTEDISEGGVRVTTHEPLEAASVNSLVVYVKRQPVACKGKVVWIKKRESKYIEDGIFFDIGMEFQDLSEHDRLIITERVETLTKQREWAERKKSNTLI